MEYKELESMLVERGPKSKGSLAKALAEIFPAPEYECRPIDKSHTAIVSYKGYALFYVEILKSQFTSKEYYDVYSAKNRFYSFYRKGKYVENRCAMHSVEQDMKRVRRAVAKDRYWAFGNFEKDFAGKLRSKTIADLRFLLWNLSVAKEKLENQEIPYGVTQVIQEMATKTRTFSVNRYNDINELLADIDTLKTRILKAKDDENTANLNRYKAVRAEVDKFMEDRRKNRIKW